MRDPYVQKNRTKPDPQIAKEMNPSVPQWSAHDCANNLIRMIKKSYE